MMSYDVDTHHHSSHIVPNQGTVPGTFFNQPSGKLSSLQVIDRLYSICSFLQVTVQNITPPIKAH